MFSWQTFNHTSGKRMTSTTAQEASLCIKEESILAWSIFSCWIKTDSHPESCARCCLPVQRLDKDRKTRFGGVVNRNAGLSCFGWSNIVSSGGSEVATCQPCRMPLGGRSHQRRRRNSHSYSARRLCGYETIAFPRFGSWPQVSWWNMPFQIYMKRVADTLRRLWFETFSVWSITFEEIWISQEPIRMDDTPGRSFFNNLCRTTQKKIFLVPLSLFKDPVSCIYTHAGVLTVCDLAWWDDP